MPGTHRTFLKEKEARNLLLQASERLKASIEQLIETKGNVEQVEIEHMTIFLINARPLLAKVEGELVPTLVFGEYFSVAPRVVVDMGAVPHICKGANVMRPGIRRFEGNFEEGDFVVVVDERHGKPLAIVEALCGRKEAERVTQGAMARNAHFVGDKLWDSLKRLAANSSGGG